MLYKDIDLHQPQVSDLSTMANKLTLTEAVTLTSDLTSRYDALRVETQKVLDDLEKQV